MIDKVLEFAFPVSEVERKTTGLFFQIVNHLIKLFKYQKSRDSEKHINDIETWIKRTCFLIFKSRSKISLNKLKKWYKYDKLENYVQGHYHSLKYDESISRDKYQTTNIVMKNIDLILNILVLANSNYNRAMENLEKYIKTLKESVL